MRRLLLIITAAVLALSVSSCYRHHVCATYVKADVENVETESIDENL